MIITSHLCLGLPVALLCLGRLPKLIMYFWFSLMSWHRAFQWVSWHHLLVTTSPFPVCIVTFVPIVPTSLTLSMVCIGKRSLSGLAFGFRLHKGMKIPYFEPICPSLSRTLPSVKSTRGTPDNSQVSSTWKKSLCIHSLMQPNPEKWSNTLNSCCERIGTGTDKCLRSGLRSQTVRVQLNTQESFW